MMKTFKDLNMGDSLYFIDGDFDIRSAKIDGIRNFDLSDQKLELFRVGKKEPFIVRAHDTKAILSIKDAKDNPVEFTCYSCFEAVNEARTQLRDSYLDKQFCIARQAFNRIKKVAVNDDRLKKRIFDFFTMGDGHQD